MMCINGSMYFISTSAEVPIRDADGNIIGWEQLNLANPYSGANYTVSNFTGVQSGVSNIYNPNDTNQATSNNTDNTYIGNFTHPTNSTNPNQQYSYQSSTVYSNGQTSSGMSVLSSTWTFLKLLTGGYVSNVINLWGFPTTFTYILWPIFGFLTLTSLVFLIRGILI